MAETSEQVQIDVSPEKPESADAEADAEDQREPSYLMQSILCAVSALEGADTQLLGASMSALQRDIGLELHDISYMTMAQLVCTNLAAPMWGILADRGVLNRRTILIAGALGQGLVTVMLAFVTDLVPMVFLRALNGIMLAALRPISNGIIADVTGEAKRGKIFGRVQSALLLGMFVTTMTVVPIASKAVLGFQGWRVAFVLVGLISVLVSTYIFLAMKEPARAEVPQQEQVEGAQKRGGIWAVWEEIASLLQFFRLPTFCVMIMQGIFGTIPWSVMGYMTLFFQLSGLPDGEVAVLSGVGPITGAVGNVLGGLVADFLARRLALHGRPLSAQITVAFGMPLMYMVFWGISPGDGGFWAYLLLLIAFGILGSWAQSGTNFPILSHIVPASSRSRVMAWECALENSVANALGPLVVSLLAEDAFGYKFKQQDNATQDIPSAKALGQAMAATICIPWGICFVQYTILHWSYPRDIKLIEEQGKKEKESVAASDVPTEANVVKES